MPFGGPRSRPNGPARLDKPREKTDGGKEPGLTIRAVERSVYIAKRALQRLRITFFADLKFRAYILGFSPLMNFTSEQRRNFASTDWQQVFRRPFPAPRTNPLILSNGPSPGAGTAGRFFKRPPISMRRGAREIKANVEKSGRDHTAGAKFVLLLFGGATFHRLKISIEVDGKNAASIPPRSVQSFFSKSSALPGREISPALRNFRERKSRHHAAKDLREGNCAKRPYARFNR